MAFIIFGTLSRSFNVTRSHLEEMQSHLRAAGFTVDTIVLNVDVGSTLVDGCLLRAEDGTSPRGYTFQETLAQAEVDRAVDALCRDQDCKIANEFYSADTQRNALRQMFHELRVGTYLKRVAHQYSVAVVVGSDLYLGASLQPELVRTAALPRHRDAIFTTDNNDGGFRYEGRGCTNGLYVGQPDALVPMLTRLERLGELLRALPKKPRTGPLKNLTHLQDYEGLVQQAITHSGKRRMLMPVPFFKVRADGRVLWQGPTQLVIPRTNQQRHEVGAALELLHVLRSRKTQWPWPYVPKWLLMHAAKQGTAFALEVLDTWRHLLDPVDPTCSEDGDRRWTICGRLSPALMNLLPAKRCGQEISVSSRLAWVGAELV